MSMAIAEISVQAFAQRCSETEKLQLIDVREPQEIELAKIEGFQVLSLSQFEHWSPRIAVEFDPTAETYVLCHHGIRSEQMCHWLQHNGFINVTNISGGIDAYSQWVNPSIPRY